MNPVLIATHNCLELTKRCVASVLSQDVPTKVCIVDNGSSDGTPEWAKENGYCWSSYNHNAGVTKAWNIGLELLLEDFRNPHVFVVNNDTVLPNWWCRRLLERPEAMASGISVGSMEEIAVEPGAKDHSCNFDFSGFLIRREAWERIGHFESSLVNYCQDLDYHLRAHRDGVYIVNSNIPFMHERSSTLRLASPKDRRLIELQADADRETFKTKWGFETWSPQYAAAFAPETFGIDHPTIREMQDL